MTEGKEQGRWSDLGAWSGRKSLPGGELGVLAPAWGEEGLEEVGRVELAGGKDWLGASKRWKCWLMLKFVGLFDRR